MQYKEALEKAMKYCAYQERAQADVRKKLKSLGCSYEDIENILCDLIEQNFLNEERFARLYIRSKFNQNGWGKKKIGLALAQKEISEYSLKNAWEEIDPEAYWQKCKEWALKQYEKSQHLSVYDRKGKVAQFLMNKGFENDMVWQICEEIETEA